MSDTTKSGFWFRIASLFYSTETKSLQNLQAKPVTVDHGATYAQPMGVRPTYSPNDAMSAYSGHGYTYAAVSRASEDLAALPLRLLKGKDRVLIEDHPVIDLMTQPSSNVDGFLFREQLVTDMILTGNCFILLLGQTEQPTSIIRLHPSNIQPVTDKTGVIAYIYRSGGQTVTYPAERVIHGRLPSWKSGPSELMGTGAIEPLAREIQADINSQNLVSNASAQARPDLLISPKDPADIWGADMRRDIASQYRKLSANGGAMVLSGLAEVSPLQLSPREMEYSRAREMARESISSVTGVPPSVLGLPSANYALSRQQARNYWSVQTKRGKRLSLLFTIIARKFDTELQFEHDYSGVEALQESRTEQLNRVQMHILNGINTRAAYKYEGLDYPEDIEGSEADYSDETAEDVRGYLARLYAVKKNDDLSTYENRKEAFESLSESTQLALERKVADHKEEVGTDPRKRTTKQILAVSYLRGIGAYETNPSSVRPSVQSAEQWGMARVNGLLFALRNLKFKRKPYDTDLLPPDHPLSSREKDTARAVGDEDPTNFPKDGDDESVSLSNSNFEVFPLAFAEDLKENYPDIWKAGGNIEGNAQYNRLKDIVGRSKKSPDTNTEEKAIRDREAWAARHFGDGAQFNDEDPPSPNISTIAGIVAQIKWFVVGELGLDKMRSIINEVKKKNLKEKARTDLWRMWIKNYNEPALRSIERATRAYLRGAAKRYADRVEEYVTPSMTKGVTDYSELLDEAGERRNAAFIIGARWRLWYQKSGDASIKDIIKQSKIPYEGQTIDPTEVDGYIDLFTRQIVRTQSTQITDLVDQALQDGKPIKQIAKELESSGKVFGAKRAKLIAQTEATRAANLGTQDAFTQATAMGIRMRKEWLSARDDKVRPAHDELDGQVVGVNENLTSKDKDGKTVEAMSPASFGIAEQDINCRCTMLPVVED